RCGVAVGADPHQRESEGNVLELRVVLVGGLAGRELALDAVDHRPARGDGEQRFADQPVVRLPVRGRDDALVDPPQVEVAPVGPQNRHALVRVARARAAGEADIAARVDRFGDSQRRRLGRRGGVVEDDQLDVGQLSPSASAFERSIAAWIAFRKAARTPARSSSRIAWIVVPPGLVTASRSSTGCMCSSRSSFAVPNIVWTTSCVVTSRERPSRMPASVIASASSAKYAGPDPETAGTASM